MLDFVVEAKIDEIRPTITATSRALDVIVKFDTDGKFRGGGTVNAQVVTGRKPNAVVVPEQSVLRPAGKVVYVEDGNKVAQRIVQTGTGRAVSIEITAGLAGGETVAVDGAGFLTNNANVAVSKPAATRPPRRRTRCWTAEGRSDQTHRPAGQARRRDAARAVHQASRLRRDAECCAGAVRPDRVPAHRHGQATPTSSFRWSPCRPRSRARTPTSSTPRSPASSRAR